MVIMFLKGLIVALIFGIPAGAIGILTAKRTLEYGFKAGFITGLGSTVADTSYALIGVMGGGLVMSFMSSHEKIISLVGGIIIILFGLSSLIPRKKESKMEKREELVDSEDTGVPNYLVFFGSSFSIAILNPATIVTFMAAFSALNIFRQYSVARGLAVVAGVCFGTIVWWLGLCTLVRKFSGKFSGVNGKYGNWLFAGFMGIFGIAIIIKGFMGR